MNTKSIVCIALLALVLAISPSDATHKLKAKVAAVAAPHIAAHVAVASSVKSKVGVAVSSSVQAIKAKKAAAVHIVTAPLQVAAKTVALKVGAVKATGAAKAAHVAGIVSTLQAHPIIVPVPVPAVVPQRVQTVVPVVKPVLPVVPVAPVVTAVPVPQHPIDLAAGKLGHVLNALHLGAH